MIGTQHDITDLKLAEEKIKQHKVHLEDMLALHRLVNNTEKEVFDFTLDACLRSLQSEFAFVGMMSADETVLTIHKWSNGIMKQCAIIDKPLEFRVAEAGLWGEAVRQRVPIIVNDYKMNPLFKKGYPEGHVPIKRFLSIPIFSGKKIVAIAAVANKVSEYTESDVTYFTSILNEMWDILDNQGTKEENSRMALMLDLAPNSITVCSLDGHFLYANQGALEIYGYSRNEFMALNIRQLVVPASAELIASRMQELFEKGVATFQVEALRKDGTLLHLEICASITVWGNIKSILSIATNITERKQAEEYIKKSLEEKEVLLREIHHRVKNNMQIVASLLNLQSQNIEDKKYKDVFIDSQSRIYAMALIHEKLYQSESLAQINLKEYIDGIVSNIFESYGQKSNIKLDINIKDILINIDYAVPCGLIINELITNSFKYAFPGGRQGIIKISAKSNNDNMIHISISDDGIGIAKDLDIRNTTSLGLKLVTSLAESQLHGKIILNRESGTEFQINFRQAK